MGGKIQLVLVSDFGDNGWENNCHLPLLSVCIYSKKELSSCYISIINNDDISGQKSMRLTQQTRNAIRVLIFCAERPDEICRISDIASACDITEFNTFKLVPILVQGQFLESIRGRYGGVKLALAPAKISIGAVVRTTENIVAQQSFQAQKPRANFEENNELFDTMMTGAFETFLQTLDEHTIADFLRSSQMEQMLNTTPSKSKRSTKTSATHN